MLSIGTEESLSTFSVDSFIPVLVRLLNHECNPDIMLLTARALTHLCDVLPSSCSTVVHYGAVPIFCARLLTIEYMDLAEQSLQALKKISQEHPTACLRAGALMAVLSYLDFFSTGVQRVALSTAANMCKKLPSDAADFVMEAVPLLTNLLQYHDSKKLQNALSSLERFPVVLSHSSRSSSGSARLSSGLSALSQPFKLRLCRAQGEKSLGDYSSNVVLIDPLASLAAIEEFLWPRVQRGESGQKSTVPAEKSESGTTAGAGVSSPSTCTPSTAHRHSTRSRSSINIGDT